MEEIAMGEKNRFQWEVRPVANEANIVKGDCYRFTVLTPALIRMEYDKEGVFEDRASQSMFYRDFETVSYTVCDVDNTLTIETDRLFLKYVKNTEFTSDTLSVSLKHEPASVWHYSDYFEELGGTSSTLDRVNGAMPIGKGVCSRSGFSVIDDSERMVLDVDGWVNVRRKNTLDIYFFGYGYDYLDAVKDYYRLTGVPAMLPAYALGNWWSRYHNYTQQEYIDLMEKFKEEDVPFSVAIVDMDWHLVDLSEDVPHSGVETRGWTGYSWNTELFPDYKAFLKYLSDSNLKTALNLHPADGCRWHEDMYEEMCKASGVNPESRQTIPFDILSPEAMANYFDVLLHPYEEDGVNFWWMDWQQGTDYRWIHEPNSEGILQDEREILDPLWMLNHLHILDIQRNGKRPIFFSRYSGPGSHRYTIGFSGDTHISWESLDFQPYFTATASNIGYSWWSHDIGGHMEGYRDDELITRWMQLGTFSPINRLHSSNNPFNSKEPWAYPIEYETTMRKYLRLRAELFPYLYTMNYRTHSKLEPLIWPMYYTHPKCSAAYEVGNQFWFGSELIVAPITQPRDRHDMMGCVNAWLPEGIWFDYFDGTAYYSEHGRKVDIFRKLDGYPVFAKAGAIVPRTTLVPHSNQTEASEELNITVFPGASNSFTLYEDQGEYYEYQNGAFVSTEMTLDYTENKAVFCICPAEGDRSLIPEKRRWRIELRGFTKELEIKVCVDDEEKECQISYDSKHHTTVLTVEASTTSRIAVFAQAEKLVFDNSDYMEKCFEILRTAQIDFRLKNELYRIVKGEYPTLRKKIEAIYSRIPSMNHLARALKEQLTLEQDEFYDLKQY